MVGEESEEPGATFLVAESRSTYRPIEELDLYEDACVLADEIVARCYEWPYFHRDTLGKQIVRSADSIAANLVEGDGRISAADSLRFFDYSRASARETQHWLKRAKARGLMKVEEADELLKTCEHISRRITKIIQYRRSRT